MANQLFHYQLADLHELSQKVVQMATEAGATQASSEVSESAGLSVTVRMGDIDTLEQTRDRGMSVTVYMGQRKGHASSSDLSDAALRDSVGKALDIARFTAEDECAGLPDPDKLAKGPHRDLKLFHPWAITAPKAVKLALEAESAARAVSPVIKNSDGASVSASHGQFSMANSHGFVGGYAYSRHGISVSPIAQKGAVMQRDDWYSSSRRSSDLAAPRLIGQYAARRAMARLGAKQISTQSVPVIFEAPLAVGLIGSLVHALSGSALYRKASFLVDSLGRQVLPKGFSLLEDPFQLAGNGSSPFDDEGVQVQARKVVDAGKVQAYFLSSYTARKLGMSPTGNAGGSHNLLLKTETPSLLVKGGLSALVRKMHRGLLVTEVMGQGVNPLTGDYSRGAFGYWVENGELQYPVEEITIAGNLLEMFSGIEAMGDDLYCRGAKTSGSLLINRMMIAGC